MRRAGLSLVVALVLSLAALPAWGAGNCSVFTTYSDGQTVNASSLN